MQPVKNKKLTYLLICAVAAVWGIIIYRVLFNESDDDYQPNFAAVKTVHEPYDQYVAKKDTFRLVLNYRDPFVGGAYVDPEPVQAVGTIAPAVNYNPPPKPPPINWSGIRYSGYVVNPQNKKLVSIIVVNGNERMVTEGEVFEGVKLLKNKRDSILVSWQGKQKYIKQ
ncbi:hypothetical protein [Pedobacter frigoris]|uniref:Type II secretion system protein GspC N-terminal domain-containing protein n=1 Tax=Pedobacter frigoris TaxID=2571272 RepID=A0A4U1CMI8_9SPHI|nr:hypothetical protein [Pedobacter frigoris]TKC09081.1 hypothetical protein FA047_03015 [Pedobacter frigoris]